MPQFETVPASRDAHKLIMEAAAPLLDDPHYAGLVYGAMGVVRTPLQAAGTVSGNRLLVKDETRQLSGAFKSRGAAHAALQAFTADPELACLVTASNGNHAQGVAQAGSRLQALRRPDQPPLATRVHGARWMTEAKQAPLRAMGVELDVSHASFEAAEQAARTEGSQPGTVYIHPFDDPVTVAGQMTEALEILSDLRALHDQGSLDVHHDPVTILSQIGGGGRTAAMAVAVHEAKSQGLLGDQVRVVGVQMQRCDAMRRAVNRLRAGETTEDLFAPGELAKECDGTAVTTVGRLTLAICADQEYVDDIVTVGKGDLGFGMQYASSVTGRPVEPAGGLAAAYARTTPGLGWAICPVTGGNVSDATTADFNRAAFAELSAGYLQEAARPVAAASARRKGTLVWGGYRGAAFRR